MFLILFPVRSKGGESQEKREEGERKMAGKRSRIATCEIFSDALLRIPVSERLDHFLGVVEP